MHTGLNGPGYYVHWGVVQISLANLVVIATMLVLFALAVLLPFPHHPAKGEPRSDDDDRR